MKINFIFKNIIKKVKPKREETESLKVFLNKLTEKLNDKINELGIDAETFIGGSFAKDSFIKKESYDVDVFVRFNRKYKDEISNLLKRILEKTFKEKISTIHGSRDYFRIKKSYDLFVEFIPVIKIRKPEEAENVTDLSYFHVKYIRKKIKSEKILDEIKLAKAFCYANGCYGAESYIGGFSGYSLELLIYYYRGFLNFIKAVTKMKDKIIIDIEKNFKDKQEIMMNLNTNKLKSPIILIDPTYKQRNVLAALSKETFEKFKEACKRFLKNPSEEAFEIKKIDYEKIKKDALKKDYEFILIETKTNKQEGDVAGSKLMKFYKFLSQEINKFFEIKNKGFDYNKKQSAKYFFVAKRKKEILISGPLVKDKENVKRFKEKHKKTFEKAGRICARKKIDFSIEDFINNWKNKNKEKIKEMNIEELKIIEWG